MLQLAHLLPLERYLTAAREEARRVCERWDVPRGKDVPEDLRDVRGRYMLTADGHRVSGLLLDADMQHGADSPAFPLLLAMFPLLASVVPIAFTLFGWAGGLLVFLAIAAVAMLCVPTLGFLGTSGTLLLGVVLPLTGGIPLGALAGLSGSWGSIGVTPLLVGLAAFWFFSKNPVAKVLALSAVGLGAVGLIDFLLFEHAHLPRGLATWAAACALPMVFALHRHGSRALALAHQGNTATIASSMPMTTAHIAARTKQAANAAKDQTAFIQLGTAKGVFTGKNDPYAPDEGTPFGLSIADLDTHLIIFGSTGQGKTSSVLRPLVVQCRRALGSVGLVVLDGKGGLPGEFASMMDYTLIEPELVDLGLIDGLSPTDVVLAFMQVNKSKEESGSAAFFTKAAGEMLRHFTVFLRACVDVEEKLAANGRTRRWQWSVESIMDLGVRAQRPNEETSKKVDGYVQAVKANHSEANVRSTLSDAIEYLMLGLPGIDADTRSGIWETLKGWITPVMSHPDLRRWASVERGVSLDSVFFGGAIGVNTPEVKYGPGGTLVQALVKQRLFAHIRRRASYDWRAAGEVPVLILGDEAHEFVGADDRVILPIARSLGAICVYATQVIENFIVKLGGHHEANGLLDCFQSAVCYKSSPATMQWMQARLGQTMTLVPSAYAGHVAYEQNSRIASEGPMSDASHAGSWLYRILARQGGAGTSAIHSRAGLLRHASGEGMDFDSLALNTASIRQAEVKMQPLLLDSEADTFTAEKGVGIAQVMRGGVRRRDVIETYSMATLPADLLRSETDGPTSLNERVQPVADNGQPNEADEASMAARELPSQTMRNDVDAPMSGADSMRAAAAEAEGTGRFDADAMFGPRAGMARKS